MPSWLAQSSPKLFSDLAIPSPLIEMLEKATVQSNPLIFSLLGHLVLENRLL